MSSLERVRKQVPTNALYTNLTAAPSSIVAADGTTVVPWLVGRPATAGALLLRDMGKTIYLPEGNTAVGMQSTILRKVQLVSGYYGTGTDAASIGSATEYYTGYIRLGAQTYGGGAPESPTAFVRAN
jgi:hypothetical protein